MTKNEKFQIRRRNTLRNLRQKLSGTPDFPVKLVLDALYLMGASYVCVKQAAWHTLAGNIPLLSPLLKAAMEHALTAYLLAGAAALPVLLLYPFGRRAAKDQLQCIGLVNHAGVAPDLLRKRRDRDNPRVTIWEFRNNSIPLQEWEKRQAAIETALGITIVKLTYAKGKSRVLVYAVPAGDDDFMVEEARKMYHKISPETGEFIDFMIEHELMDLKNKPGKAATGYMTFLPDYRAPFVFSNFNQTIFDMQVLTHELGHAFAGYMAMREQPITEYYSESTDIAEIHSMSMEQFSYPYAEAFFGKYADKFRFAHLQEAITFVPFGVAVDEFQHICYANPELTPKERTAEWKKLEEKYMPWRKYDADDFFDRGGFWYHKLHIYLYPFYYINYTLTTMGAMEFKKKNYENHETAWQDYLNLCKCGGSMSYLETLRYANLSNPFEPGSVARAMEVAKQELMNSPFMR